MRTSSASVAPASMIAVGWIDFAIVSNLLGDQHGRDRGFGDQLRLHMKKQKQRRNMWWYRGEAMVDGVLVAEATVSAMLVTE